MRVAIIDLGTNTFHLLIADIYPDRLHSIHKEKQSVKIGEGGISRGEITKEAQDRALKTLKHFATIIARLGVQQSHASATSAFRNASNGSSLVKEIFNQTSIKINIIDGQQEARLIYLGVKQALDLGSSNSLIIDIGGGSVEFIIGNQTESLWSQSFEIGAQRLMDQFHLHDPIQTEEIQCLESYLEEKLTSLAHAMDQFQVKTLVGSSGTFDTLSQIHCLRLGIEKLDEPEQPLDMAGFTTIHSEIIAKNRAKRMLISGMIEMRVDMIVVASCLINYILNRYALNEIRISSYALKEGVLHEIATKVRGV